MRRWPWATGTNRGTQREALEELDPATRQKYRDLDRANILARIDRFAQSAVETAWGRIGERRKMRADAGSDDPVVQALVRDSVLAVVNFIRHQLFDPALRSAQLRHVLEQQAARWRSLAAADPAILDAALRVIAQQRAAIEAGEAPKERISEPPSSSSYFA
ncbi:MAG: hypothetical protein RMM58_01665 [Chloroflexota bacterium]|nr:hypothetical protein [Dehalococcoidia bacterium]MDW8252567.1 hypothetical protein [Chloroflexota bacterium]